MNRYKKLWSLILAGVLMGTGIATARHSATGRARPWFAGARRTPYSRIISIGDSLSDLGNLFALADRHQVDVTRWPYLPDGDHQKLRAYGRCKAHMDRPRQIQAPSASDLELMNTWWVEHVFQPTVEFNLEGD